MNDKFLDNTDLVSEEQLKAWTGYERRADIRKFLENDLGLTVRLGKGGRICCTATAIREAMVGTPQQTQFDKIEFIK